MFALAVITSLSDSKNWITFPLWFDISLSNTTERHDHNGI